MQLDLSVQREIFFIIESKYFKSLAQSVITRVGRGNKPMSYKSKQVAKAFLISIQGKTTETKDTGKQRNINCVV